MNQAIAFLGMVMSVLGMAYFMPPHIVVLLGGGLSLVILGIFLEIRKISVTKK